MKKTLCIIFSAVLLLTLLPGFVLGAEIVDSGACGTNLTWTLDDEGTLTISGTGAMENYGYANPYSYYAPWGGSAANRDRIKTVVIGNGVTSIGGGAFRGCQGLTSVTIPDSVTSIGGEAFSGCTGLTSVTIPNSVTSIGGDVFDGCTGLTSLTIGKAIENCTLYDLGIPQDQDNLKTVIITEGTSSIRKLAFSFYHTGVQGNYFSGYSALEEISIPDSITSIGIGAFGGCTGLKSVKITDLAAWCGIDFNGTNSNPLENAHTLYLNGEPIEDMTIPDGVTSIGGYAFSGCTGLTSVTFPDSVTSIEESAFSGCSGLKSVTFSDGMTSIGISAFSGCKALAEITIPASVTKIFENAFRNDSKLKTVYFKGTEEQWDAMEIEDGNIALLRAQVIFNENDPCQAAGGHTWNDGEITTPATCAREGVKTYTCTVCGETKTEPVAKTTEHTWNGGEITTPATCAKEGVKTFTCTVCGETKTESVAKTTEHTWNGGEITTPATCAEEGEKTYICTVCGTAKTEKIPATGHIDRNRDGYCDIDNTPMGGDGSGQNDGGNQNEEKCPYCGQTHTGFLGDIISIFHQIAYFFKTLFRR